SSSAGTFVSFQISIPGGVFPASVGGIHIRSHANTFGRASFFRGLGNSIKQKARFRMPISMLTTRLGESIGAALGEVIRETICSFVPPRSSPKVLIRNLSCGIFRLKSEELEGMAIYLP